MLDELGLINMNARIYDPLLGRFLSADTIVQNAGSLQSYNRYSYCDNNPLSRIDPTGHSWLSKALKSIRKFFKKVFWRPVVAYVIAGLAGLALYYSEEIWDAVKPYVGTIVTVVFTMFGMPFVGALVGSAIQTAINGGSVKDFLIGMVINSVAGYCGCPISGSIARSMGLAAREIAFSMVRGAVSGAISGAMAAVVYGRKIWEGIMNGALMGAATSAVIHLYRSYKTEQFIKNNLDLKMGSDAGDKYMLNAVRDAGQSPSGSRMYASFMSKGEILTLRDISQYPSQDAIAMDSPIGICDHGPEGLTPTNNVYFDMEALGRSGLDPATVLCHEMGHTVGGGFIYGSTPEQEVTNVQNTNNRYEWWMGYKRTSMYGPIGSLIYDQNSCGYVYRECIYPVGPRPFLQNLIHPGY